MRDPWWLVVAGVAVATLGLSEVVRLVRAYRERAAERELRAWLLQEYGELDE